MRKKFFLLSLFFLVVFLGVSFSLTLYQEKKFVNDHQHSFKENYLALKKVSTALFNPAPFEGNKAKISKKESDTAPLWEDTNPRQESLWTSLWTGETYFTEAPEIHKAKGKKGRSPLFYALNHDHTFRKGKPSSLQFTYEEVGEVVIDGKEKLITLTGQADFFLSFSPFLTKTFRQATTKLKPKRGASPLRAYRYNLLPPHPFTATLTPEEGRYYAKHTLKDIHHQIGHLTDHLTDHLEETPPYFDLNLQSLTSEQTILFPPSKLPLWGRGSLFPAHKLLKEKGVWPGSLEEFPIISWDKKHQGEAISLTTSIKGGQAFHLNLESFLYTVTSPLDALRGETAENPLGKTLTQESQENIYLEKMGDLTLKNLSYSNEKEQNNTSQPYTHTSSYRQITLPTLQAKISHRYKLPSLPDKKALETSGQANHKKSDQNLKQEVEGLSPFLAELTLSYEAEALMVEGQQNKTSLGSFRVVNMVKRAQPQVINDTINQERKEGEEKIEHELNNKEEPLGEELINSALANAKLHQLTEERFDKNIDKVFTELSHLYQSFSVKKEELIDNEFEGDEWLEQGITDLTWGVKRDGRRGLERSLTNLFVPLISALFLQIDEGEFSVNAVATNQKEAYFHLNFEKEHLLLTPLNPLELYSFFTAFKTFQLEVNLPKAYLLHQGALLAETLKEENYSDIYQNLDDSLMVGYLFLSLLLPKDYKFYNAQEQLFWLQLVWQDGELTLNDYPITEQELFEILNI